MQVKLPNIVLELTEYEARKLGFALHEYIWTQARKYKENHPDKTFEDFMRLEEPLDGESSNLMSMWLKLAKFWKQEDAESFELLIKEKVFT